MRRAIYQTLTKKKTRAITGTRVAIRCGTSAQYIDSFGKLWLTDRYFYDNVGNVATYRNNVTVSNTFDPELYKDIRYANNYFTETPSEWGYNIPVDLGTYQVNLLFAETFSQPSPPGRTASININNVRKLTNFDEVLAAGGQNKASQIVFGNIQSVAGFIDIKFILPTQNFYISALELTPV